MSETATFTPITGMEVGPAVWLPGWLPDIDAFPELVEARSEYKRLHEQWSAAGGRRQVLEARLEVATEAHKAALRDAYLQGADAPKPKHDVDKLTAELAEAREHGQAAGEAYLAHINSVIGLVIEHGHEWQEEITTFQENVDAEVQALLAQALTLRTTRSNFFRLSHWIERTVRGGELPMEHFPYSEIQAPPADEAEEAALAQVFFERSYAGSPRPERMLSDEEGRELEQQVLSPQRQRPVADADVEVVQVPLSDLDEDDLVDWLMSTGGFDGNTKPTPRQVINLAEGDVAIAQRLVKAERRAGGDAVRQEVIDKLTQITNGE
jgi:hypothetical protein